MRQVTSPVTGAALVGVLACLGCSQEAQRFSMIFDPCVPTVLEPAAGATEDERASVREAVELWDEVAAVALSTDAPSLQDDADLAPRRLPVEFIDEQLFMGRFNDQTGAIEIARRVNDPRIRSIVLAHEIGHAIGLYHVSADERRSVMHEGNKQIPPTREDARALAHLWGDCVMAER